MATITHWLVRLFYWSADDRPANDALNALLKAFAKPTVFFGDNLFTFGKSLEFLNDQRFMSAFLRAMPDNVEKSCIWRKHTLYWAAQRAMTLEGDFVEAACYKGFTARVLCNAFDLTAAGKNFWLYDLFDQPADEARRLEAHSPSLYDSVIARFADEQAVRIIKGRLPGSFAEGCPERVSPLHLDMNNPEGETGVLEALFDRIVPGGVIILDDYGWYGYPAQTKAHKAWFDARSLGILELPTGQGLIIK